MNTTTAAQSTAPAKSEESARIAMREAGFGTNLEAAVVAHTAYLDAANVTRAAGLAATLPQIAAAVRAGEHSTRVASTLTGPELTAFTKFMRQQAAWQRLARK